MQAPIHILSGAVVNRFFKWSRYRAVGIFIMFLVAVMMHAIFDKLAVITFQAALSDFSNPFVVVYHVAEWLLSITFLYIWWEDYKWGILFSLIPDIDWLILFPQTFTDTQLIFYHDPVIHNCLSYWMDHMYPFCFMNNLINLSDNTFAVFVEIAIVAILLLIIRIIHQRRRNIHF